MTGNKFGRDKDNHHCLTVSLLTTNVDICITGYCIVIAGAQ